MNGSTGLIKSGLDCQLMPEYGEIALYSIFCSGPLYIELCLRLFPWNVHSALNR